jgi:hypothetical protein
MENQPQFTPVQGSSKPNAIVAFMQAKRTWPTWAIIVALFVVFGLGHVSAGSSNNDTSTTSAVTTSTTAAAHGATTMTKPTATPAPKTTTIASYSGNGNKNTPNFHVNADQWTISWSCQGGQYGGNLIVDVYQSDGTYVDGAVNVICNGAMHDTTLERGSGDFYLVVNADVSWTVTIQATQ